MIICPGDKILGKKQFKIDQAYLLLPSGFKLLMLLRYLIRIYLLVFMWGSIFFNLHPAKFSLYWILLNCKIYQKLSHIMQESFQK